MRSWPMLAAVALAGCRTILGIDDPVLADDDAPPDATGTPAGLETARITPQMCVIGPPGEPGCPINRLALPGSTGSTIDFVIRSFPEGIDLTDVRIVAGAEGVFVEHPWFVVWPFGPDVPIPDPLDRYLGLRLNIPPGGAAPLASAAVELPPVGELAISATFDAISDYAPPPP